MDFILGLIHFLGRIQIELERAFVETYGEYAVGIEAAKEVEKRKRQNKEKLMEYIRAFVRERYYKVNNYLIDKKMEDEYSQMMFEEYKSKGKIDEMNNYIGGNNG